MIIKTVDLDDQNDFLELNKAFYNSGATKRGYDAESAIKTFNQIISRHENLWSYIFIDEETECNAGYAILTSYWCNEEAGNVVILDELYLDPAFRHHGYGKAIMEWLEREFKDKAVSITLEVLSTNVVAHELYKREGYNDDGFIIMEKRLN